MEFSNEFKNKYINSPLVDGTVSIIDTEKDKVINIGDITSINFLNDPTAINIELYPSILRYDFELITSNVSVLPTSTMLQDLVEPVVKKVIGKLTKKEIIDFTLRVARRLKTKAIRSRKQIHFRRLGSTTSIAHSGWQNYIEYSDDMLQEGNIHYKYHTIIHEVCHILCRYKYGNGCNHNHNFVLEEMKAHTKFGYRTYYPTKEEGYIVALKELSTNKYVFVKYNYEINDKGFPMLKKKEHKERRDNGWRKDAERKFLAKVIIKARKECNGAKVHTIHISKGGRGWREVYAYYKCNKGDEKYYSECYYGNEIAKIFKSNVSKEQKRVGLIYEWKRQFHHDK
jgi:hypothetical protein